MSNMPKGLPFFLIVWFIGMILGWTYDGFNTPATWGGTGSGGLVGTTPQDLMGGLMNGNVASQKLPLIGDVSFVVASAGFFLSLFKIIFWQFSFIQGFPIVAWIFAFFGVMCFWAMCSYLLSMIRGNVTWG